MSEQLFEEAKREVARFLLEQHNSMHVGLAGRIRKRLLGVKIPRTSVYDLFAKGEAAGEDNSVKRYARSIETDEEVVEEAQAMKQLPHVGPVIRAILEKAAGVSAPKITGDVHNKVASWGIGHKRLLAALEKETIIRISGKNILINRRQANALNEFLRRTGS